MKEPTTAVILAGGHGSRLGGIEKGDIRIGDDRLIDLVVDAAMSVGCSPVVIAGEIRSGDALNVLEEPRFGGPVAALGAALPEVAPGWLLLLSCDLPRADEVCRVLTEAAVNVAEGSDGLVLVADGRRQWLAGLYRTESIRASLESLATTEGKALRELMGGLNLTELEDGTGLTRDIDTPEDLELLRKRKANQ